MTQNGDCPDNLSTGTAPEGAPSGDVTINEATRKAAEEISRRVAQARARRETTGKEGETAEPDWVLAEAASLADDDEPLPDSPPVLPSAVPAREAGLSSLTGTADGSVHEPLQVSRPAQPGAPSRERHEGLVWGHADAPATVLAHASGGRRARARWRSWPASVLVVLSLLLLGLHVWPFEARRQHLEQALSVQLSQRVHVQGLRLSLLPRPHWRIRRLVVGETLQGELQELRAYPALAELFADQPSLRRLDVAAVRLPSGLLKQALFAHAAPAGLQLAELEIERLMVDLPGVDLPALTARVQFAQTGQWRELELGNSELDWRVRLLPQSAAELKLTAQLGRWPEAVTPADVAPSDAAAAPASVPGMGALPLKAQQLYLQGLVSSHGMRLQEFSALLVADALQANLRATGELDWQQDWRLSGQAEIKGLDAAQLAPLWLASGRVDLNSRFEFAAATPAAWFAAPRLQGEFTVHRGSVLGVDLGRVLQGGSAGGQSLFAALQGRFDYADQVLDLTAVRLESGAISAQGRLRVAADDSVRGMFEVALRSGGHQRQAGLEVSGELGSPRFEMR